MSAESSASNPGYKIWAADDVVYGPVELPTLVDWVGDERVLASTWVFSTATESWGRAGDLPELVAFFGASSPSPATSGGPVTPLVPGVKPGSLRRVKIFSAMTDQQLGRFAQLMEVVKVLAFKDVVKQGGPGDAMYAVLEGELRARMMVGGRETTLATFQVGDVFGEITLFDDGPRSADVLANIDSTLLKISSTKFDELCAKHPDLATPLLLALGKTLTGRIRNDNKRLGELVTLARASH
jgi:hypothetical protein